MENFEITGNEVLESYKTIISNFVADHDKSQLALVLVIVVIVLTILFFFLVKFLAKKPLRRSNTDDSQQYIPFAHAEYSNRESTTSTTADAADDLLERQSSISSISQDSIPAKKKTNRVQPIHISFDFDGFLYRFHQSGFLVERVKGNVKKARTIKISQYYEFCVYKSIGKKKGNAYIKLPLKKLVGCFEVDGFTPPSIILEFESKSFHFALTDEKEMLYLLAGLQTLISRIMYDQTFFETYQHKITVSTPKIGFRSPLSLHSPTSQTSGQLPSISEDDQATVSTKEERTRKRLNSNFPSMKFDPSSPKSTTSI